MFCKTLRTGALFILFISFCFGYPRGVKDYRISQREHVVIVIRKDMDKKEAKEIGTARSAEIANDKGYRYFIIKSEKDVTFIGEEDEGFDKSFPRNIYQEDIVERGMGREPFEEKRQVQFPALKMVIEFVKYKSVGSLDVCDYIDC